MCSGFRELGQGDSASRCFHEVASAEVGCPHERRGEERRAGGVDRDSGENGARVARREALVPPISAGVRVASDERLVAHAESNEELEVAEIDPARSEAAGDHDASGRRGGDAERTLVATGAEAFDELAGAVGAG